MVPEGRAMQIFRDQRGQTTILIALCLLCLLGLTGFAVDAGMMFRAKRNLQIAADAAAISGAAELNYGDAAAAAQAAAVQNGETTGANGASGPIPLTPVYGPFATKSGYVEVIVSQVEPTYFMKALHLNSMTVSARAVGTVATTANCLVTLGSTAPGISVTNGASLTISSCGIIDDATGSGALTAIGASITTTSVGVVGTTSINNGGTVTPTPVTGITTVADPLSYFATPPPSSDYTSGCSADPKISTSRTIGPSTSGGYVCYEGLTISNGSTATLK